MPDYDPVWDAIVSESTIDQIRDATGYSEREIEQGHIELFQDYVPDDYTDAQELQMWGDYLLAMVESSRSYSHNEFFSEYNINPADFDWEAWREAMGYD